MTKPAHGARTRDTIVEAVHRSWWNVDRDLGVGSELLYTADGVCVMPAMTMRGRAEIAHGYAMRQANGPRLSRHLVSNLVTDAETDAAVTATYVVSLFAGNGVAPLDVDAPSAICDVVDRFVLAGGEWLIEHRRLTAVFVASTNDSVLLGRGGNAVDSRPDAGRDDVPIVLVHGWGGTYQTAWSGSPLETAIERAGREIIPIGLPGHSPSGESHDPADYEQIADQLAARLPQNTPVDAIGFSLGGKLLLQLAAERPDRFRRIAVGGVGANLFRPEAGEAVSTMLLNGLPDDAPATVRAVIEEARGSGNDPLALSAVIRRPPRTVAPTALAAITAEVLVVTGDDDVIAGDLGPLAEVLPPAADTVLVPGLDHMSTPRSPAFVEHAGSFVLRPADRATPTT